VRWTLRIACIALGAMVLGSAVALAAGAALTSRTVGSGAASVGRCDSDGVAVGVTVSGGNVVSTILTGIAPACGGRTASVTVSGTTTSSGTAAVPGGGGSLTITLAAAVPVVQSMRLDLVMSGP
jgi:hypothetical protein